MGDFLHILLAMTIFFGFVAIGAVCLGAIGHGLSDDDLVLVLFGIVFLILDFTFFVWLGTRPFLNGGSG
jgi:hypothetical protein